MSTPSSPNLADLHFMDARCKLIDLAAFFDRMQRHHSDDDFRVQALQRALTCLDSEEPNRARRVLESLSDPSESPIKSATVQGAFGAYDPGSNRV